MKLVRILASVLIVLGAFGLVRAGLTYSAATQETSPPKVDLAPDQIDFSLAHEGPPNLFLRPWPSVACIAVGTILAVGTFILPRDRRS